MRSGSYAARRDAPGGGPGGRRGRRAAARGRRRCWCATPTTRSTPRSACDSTRPHPLGTSPPSRSARDSRDWRSARSSSRAWRASRPVTSSSMHAATASCPWSTATRLRWAVRDDLLGSIPPSRRPEIHLGLLGGTGLTAWAGIVLVASTRAGETVWVSAAAGAVGSVAAQLAKARGCRVVGSAGGARRLAYLRDDLGLDAAFDYHQGVGRPASPAAPDGNRRLLRQRRWCSPRGGYRAIRPFGRVALCGAISGYDGRPGRGPTNLFLATARNLTIRGFRAGAFVDRADEARAGSPGCGETAGSDSTCRPTPGWMRRRARSWISCGRNIGKCLVVD